MDNEVFDVLEKQVESLIMEFNSLKQEIVQVREDNQRLLAEREGFKVRVDAILKKLEGI